MSITVSSPSYDRIYSVQAWEDNNICLVMVQGEGATSSGVIYNSDGTINIEATVANSVEVDHVKAPRFQLHDRREKMSLASCTVTLALTRPDGATDELWCNIEDASNGVISCPITASATSVAGDAMGEIRVASPNGLIKFYGIHIKIYDGVSNDSAVHSTQFEALIAALQKVGVLDGTNTVTLDTIITENGTNPVASGILYDYLYGDYKNYLAGLIPTKTSDLTNDSGFLTQHQDISGKMNLAPVITTTDQLAALSMEQVFEYDGDYYVKQSATPSFSSQYRLAALDEIPTKTSELANDSGFLTQHQDISGKMDLAASRSDTLNVPKGQVFKSNGAFYIKDTNDRAPEMQVQLMDQESCLRVRRSADDPPSQGLTRYSRPTIWFKTSTYKMWKLVGIIGNGGIDDGGVWHNYYRYTWEPFSIPTKTSDLTNDSGFLTQHQDISGKMDKAIFSSSGTDNEYNQGQIAVNNGEVWLKTTTIGNPGHKTLAEKATTLAGYGITDAYTKTEVDGIVPVKTSDLTNDSGFLTRAPLIYTGTTDKSSVETGDDIKKYYKNDFYINKNNGKCWVCSAVSLDTSASPALYQYSWTYIDVLLDVSGKEDSSNKVTSLSAQSTNDQYPSAKCVYDMIGDVESVLASLL